MVAYLKKGSTRTLQLNNHRSSKGCPTLPILHFLALFKTPLTPTPFEHLIENICGRLCSSGRQLVKVPEIATSSKYSILYLARDMQFCTWLKIYFNSNWLRWWQLVRVVTMEWSDWDGVPGNRLGIPSLFSISNFSFWLKHQFWSISTYMIYQRT